MIELNGDFIAEYLEERELYGVAQMTSKWSGRDQGKFLGGGPEPAKKPKYTAADIIGERVQSSPWSTGGDRGGWPVESYLGTEDPFERRDRINEIVRRGPIGGPVVSQPPKVWSPDNGGAGFPWHGGDPVGIEPPLGYDVNEVPPNCGGAGGTIAVGENRAYEPAAPLRSVEIPEAVSGGQESGANGEQ
jgi:hypothetical protein